MTTERRIGLWFGPGLENALAARAALGDLQVEYPFANWVLFGPRESLFLFEMDNRVPVYIPLRAMEPRRAAQSRFSYFLEKRAQAKQLSNLKLHECVGILVLPNDAANKGTALQFKHVLRMLSVAGHLIERPLHQFLDQPRPLLEAGPQSLAFATQHHRKTPPNAMKCLALLNSLDPHSDLKSQCLAVQRGLSRQVQANNTWAVILGNDRLLARRLKQTHPDWLQVSPAQAMGLIAYADQVICCSALITQICSEMGRFDRLVLVKSDS